MMEFEPWVQHDGGPAPRRQGHVVVAYAPSDGRVHLGDTITQTWPGWFWRMKRVRTGFLRWEVRPVCYDSAYAPIIAYRFLKPPRATVSTAEELINEISDPAISVGSLAGAHPASQPAAPQSGCGDTSLLDSGRRWSSPGLCWGHHLGK